LYKAVLRARDNEEGEGGSEERERGTEERRKFEHQLRHSAYATASV